MAAQSDQIEHCLERAAFIEEVARRISVHEQRDALLEVARQWREKAVEAGKPRPQSAVRPLRLPLAARG